MIECIAMFIIRGIDTMLSTAKTVLITKNKKLGAAVMASICTVMYGVTTLLISNSKGPTIVIVMSVSTFLFTLLGFKLGHKLVSEYLYMFDVTTPSLESGMHLKDALIENGFTVRSNSIYTESNLKTVSLEISCETREQSSKLENILKEREDVSWFVYICEKVGSSEE